jgi:L-alanine-DL-glutamate epimerase-like enolase superfamily enzyme
MVNPTGPKLAVRIESWPIAGQFTISRGAKTEARVVVVELSEAGLRGLGECVPYARYGENVEGVAAHIEAMAEKVARGLDRHLLQTAMPAGAARNALDCAFWDLEAKRNGRRVHELAGLPAPRPLTTAYTISLGSTETMVEAARKAAARPLLKIKLGAEGDAARIKAIRSAVPDTELIVDANEGWGERNLEDNLRACAEAGVVLVEQPLPAGADDLLAKIDHAVPVCADESAHDALSLPQLLGKYDAVNIKLDKTGGLTQALVMAKEAEDLGLGIMAGCMVATSLSMAPAILVAQRARFVDLDGPLLLARDREPALRYETSTIYPADPGLWG